MSQTTSVQRPLSGEFGDSSNDASVEKGNLDNHGNPTIPINKGGKSYTMEEVFQVWTNHKDEFLKCEHPSVANEKFRTVEPGEIYHLEVKASTIDPPIEPSSELKDSFASIQSLREKEEERIAGNWDVPPGMSAINVKSAEIEQYPINGDTRMISPEKIEWFYIDPSGNEQGPFNGEMMQDWLSNGYLTLDLKIRRKEDMTFVTLKELCESVQNFIHPFRVPIPELTHQPGVAQDQGLPMHLSGMQASHPTAQNQTQTHLHNLLGNGPNNVGFGNLSLNGSLSSTSNLLGNDFVNQNDPFAPAFNATSTNGFTNANQFGIDQLNQGVPFGQTLNNPLQGMKTIPSLLHQQILQQPVLSRSNSGWGIDHSSSMMGSAPGTPVSVAPTLGTQVSQQVPLSPWVSGVQSQSRVNSPFVASSIVPGDVNTSEKTPSSKSKFQAGGGDSVIGEMNTKSVTDILNDEHEREDGASKSAIQTSDLNDTTNPDVMHGMKDGKRSLSTLSQNVVSPIETKQENDTTQDESKSSSGQYEDTNISSQPFSSEIDSLSVSKIEKVQDANRVSPSKPVVAPWASSSNTAEKPALTLKEIQLLEAQKVKEQKKIEDSIKGELLTKIKSEDKLTSKPSLPKTSSWGVNGLSQPQTTKKTLAEIQREELEAAKAKASSTSTESSFASALAKSVPKDDTAWTTVASKKPLTKKPTQTTGTYNVTSSTKPATPQLLRSVSAASSVKSSVDSGALKEDFLVWARSMMTNLYPTVSRDDLLEIFTALPSNNDSLQLVSETIYSSSTTMDGRRFAQEFLKRKQKVEAQVNGNDTVSWRSAIASSANKVATVDEDGWSTNSKSRKKGKNIK